MKCKCAESGLPFGANGMLCGDPECDYTKRAEENIKRVVSAIVADAPVDPLATGDSTFKLPDMRERR
jgi:hypothetical protein